MNNRYFGNIHDFCKYGLLRHMAAECGVRLGVCWMLTSGDGRPNLDFQHLRKRLDPELHNWLQTQRVRAEKEGAEWGVQMMEEGRIGGAGVIPNADYFGELMPDVVAERRKYFGAMLDKFRGKKDLIFLDPDFGLGFTAREFTGERGDGYLHAGEVARCVNAGFSVMFYQDWRSQFPHPNPKITHGEDDPATKIRGALRREGVRAPVFRLELNAAYEGRKKEETGGTIARLFLVQHPENSAVDIEAFLKSFQESAWCKKTGGVFAARQRVGVFIDAENSGDAKKSAMCWTTFMRLFRWVRLFPPECLASPPEKESTTRLGKSGGSCRSDTRFSRTLAKLTRVRTRPKWRWRWTFTTK